jgi:hypothetical protein
MIPKPLEGLRDAAATPLEGARLASLEEDEDGKEEDEAFPNEILLEDAPRPLCEDEG